VIVIDASALTAFIMKEESYQYISSYIKECISVDHIIKEVGNSIWKAYVRGYISNNDAIKRFEILIKLMKNVIQLINEIDLIEEAMKIAMENKITIYDSLYIALAFKKKIPLLTIDNTQAKIAKKYNLEVVKP